MFQVLGTEMKWTQYLPSRSSGAIRSGQAGKGHLGDIRANSRLEHGVTSAF